MESQVAAAFLSVRANMDNLAADLSKSHNIAVQGVQRMAQGMQTAFKSNMPGEAVFAGITAGVQKISGPVSGALTNLSSRISAFGVSAGQAVSNAFSAAGKASGNSLISGLGSAAGVAAGLVVRGLAGIVSTTATVAAGSVRAFAGAFQAADLGGKLGASILPAFGGIASKIGMVTGILPAMGIAGQTAMAVMGSAGRATASILVGLGGLVTGNLTVAFAAFSVAAVNVIRMVTQALQGVIGIATVLATSMIRLVGDLLGGGIKLVSGLIGGLVGTLGAVVKGIVPLFGGIIGGLISGVGKLVSFVGGALGGMVQGISTAVASVVGAIGGVIGKLLAHVSAALGTITQVIAGALGGLIGSVLQPALSALGKSPLHLNTWVDWAIKFEAAEARLAATLEGSGQIAGWNSSQLEAMARNLEKTTVFTYEQVRAAQSMILMHQGIRGDQFTKLLDVAGQLAMKMGTELQQPLHMLTRALERPEHAMSMLHRMGITLTNSEGELIKQFMAVNDVARAQDVVLARLASNVGPVGEKMAATMEFAVASIKKSWENVGKSVGQALLPIARVVAEFLRPLVEGFASTMKAMIGGVNDTTKSWAENAIGWIKANRDTIVMWGRQIAGIVTAVATVIKDVFISVGRFIASVFSSSTGGVGNASKSWVNSVSDAMAHIKALIEHPAEAWVIIKQAGIDAWESILDFLYKQWGVFLGWLEKTVVAGLNNLGIEGKTLGEMWEAGVSKVEDIWDNIKSTITDILPLLKSMADAVGVLGGLVYKVSEGWKELLYNKGKDTPVHKEVERAEVERIATMRRIATDKEKGPLAKYKEELDKAKQIQAEGKEKGGDSGKKMVEKGKEAEETAARRLMRNLEKEADDLDAAKQMQAEGKRRIAHPRKGEDADKEKERGREMEKAGKEAEEAIRKAQRDDKALAEKQDAAKKSKEGKPVEAAPKKKEEPARKSEEKSPEAGTKEKEAIGDLEDYLRALPLTVEKGPEPQAKDFPRPEKYFEAFDKWKGRQGAALESDEVRKVNDAKAAEKAYWEAIAEEFIAGSKEASDEVKDAAKPPTADEARKTLEEAAKRNKEAAAKAGTDATKGQEDYGKSADTAREPMPIKFETAGLTDLYKQVQMRMTGGTMESLTTKVVDNTSLMVDAAKEHSELLRKIAETRQSTALFE